LTFINNRNDLAELRVLVSYPYSEEDIKTELNYLHKVISETDLAQEISDDNSLLFIIGWKCEDEFLWFGCLFNLNGWSLLPQASVVTDIDSAFKKSTLKESIFSSKPIGSLR
jgi:hypothetical protein